MILQSNNQGIIPEISVAHYDVAISNALNWLKSASSVIMREFWNLIGCFASGHIR